MLNKDSSPLENLIFIIGSVHMYILTSGADWQRFYFYRVTSNILKVKVVFFFTNFEELWTSQKWKCQNTLRLFDWSDDEMNHFKEKIKSNITIIGRDLTLSYGNQNSIGLTPSPFPSGHR